MDSVEARHGHAQRNVHGASMENALKKANVNQGAQSPLPVANAEPLKNCAQKNACGLLWKITVLKTRGVR